MNFAKGTAARPTLASRGVSPEHEERIHDMFPPNSAVALFGVGHSASTACQQVASELFLFNRRVVVVPVLTVLQTKPLPNPNLTGARQAGDGTYWVWPAVRARTFERVERSQSDLAWISSLRDSFDCVLLDCPDPETTPGCTAIARLAQSALLAVEADQTSRKNILHTKHVIQSAGIRLEGSILIQPGKVQ